MLARPTLAVIIAMLLHRPAEAAGTARDFDLACAVVAAAEIATTVKDSEEWQTAFMVSVFYIGRMGGRDDKTYWSAVVKGRIAELREKAKSPELYGKCLDFLTKQL